MAKFFAGVLSVIAVGVLLIAYGLLSPRAAAYGTAPFDPLARPMLTGGQISLDDPYAARYYYGASGNAPVAPYGYVTVPAAAPVRAVVTQPVATQVVATQPVRARTQVVERAPGRNWQKTALVIGGTTAAGAGVGGLIGGKKGALIGAAIGGGGSTLYEAMKK